MVGFHLAPGGYLADLESDSGMMVWGVLGFRISGVECRRSPLRESIGEPRVNKLERKMVTMEPPVSSLFTSLLLPSCKSCSH